MKTNYFVGFSVAGLILLNCQSSIAFSIYPSRPGATFRYQPASSYSFKGSRWQTEINYDTWTQPLPRGGTPILKNTLKFLWAPRSTPPLGQGWKFESANRDLEGFFDIKTYYACAFREPCGGPTDVGPEGSNPERPSRLTTGVGAVFGLKYNPRGSDPTPLNNNLHWIQVVRSNRTNPIGAMRGEIWTQPKVFAISLICILNFLILWEDKENLKLPQSWKINRLLWEIFLGIGLIATLASPFPWRSLFGQEQMGDGLLYWLLIVIFTLSIKSQFI